MRGPRIDGGAENAPRNVKSFWARDAYVEAASPPTISSRVSIERAFLFYRGWRDVGNQAQVNDTVLV